MMLKPSILISNLSILLIALVVNSVTAQSIKTKLSPSSTVDILISTDKVADSLLIPHNPLTIYPHWSLRNWVYYGDQSIYENLKDNPESIKSFREFALRYKVDTIYLTKQKIPGNKVYLTTAIDSLGKKHVIVDANNNHDFSDDKEYIFDLGKDKDQHFIIDVNISYFDGRDIKPAAIPIKLTAFQNMIPDDHYSSPLEKQLDVAMARLSSNLTSDITIGDKKYKIIVFNSDKLRPKARFGITIQKLPFDEKNNNDHDQTSDDTLTIADNLYRVKYLKNDTLDLLCIGKRILPEAETGTLAPAINKIDIQTGKPFNLTAQKGKYILIDFWGSWCNPCIALLPELARLHKKYLNKIQFVSIAFDKPEDKPKVLKLIKQNNMNWIQLMDKRNSHNEIIDHYKISYFPSGILIDPSGTIVYRGVGEDGLKKLIDWFDSNAKLNN